MDAGSVVFDRHRLERRIGKGGMGEVWLATDLLLEQPVALKRISLAGVGEEQAELVRNRALREGRVAARLRHHRHVVATYDMHVGDGDVWLVLDTCLPGAWLRSCGRAGRWSRGRSRGSALRWLMRWWRPTRWESSIAMSPLAMC